MSVPRLTARLVVAGFCWTTAAYAFVVSSAFAYVQFVRPRVFPWIGYFSDWHAAASLVWLALLAAVLWQDRRRVRILAVSLFAVSAVACGWNAVHPVLPRLADGPGSILAGVLALVPLAWLAAIDQVHASAYLRWQKPPEDERELRAFEGRLFVASIATGLFLSVLFAALTSIALVGAFEPDLLLPGLARGFGAALAGHLTILGATFLVLALMVRLTTRHFAVQYLALTIVLVGLLAIVFDRLIGDSLSFHGAWAVAAALATSISVVGTWTGLRLRRLEAARTSLDSAIDLYLGHAGSSGAEPVGGGLREALPPTALRLAAVGLLAYAFMAISARADWDFVVLDTGVLVVWLCSFGVIHRPTAFYRSVSAWMIATACLVPLAAVVAIQASSAWRQSLNRYAVYNPSFRVVDALLRDTSSANPTFDQYLRSQTGLTDVGLAPVDLDFVADLASPSTRLPGPPIFLFVIDSLRPDYLAPYNHLVRFTPHFAEFAADSVVFKNAFTAFGGTGLSLPAIWAGASLVHKQYVKPFHPMNTLEKLLEAHRYRLFVGLDSIMSQLLVPSDAIEELDRGRNVMDYEFCRTLEELESKLRDVDGAAAPVFAYSLPQDIHMSRLPRTVESGGEMQSFYAPYATKVRALDACFGRFIDALERLGLYEKSLIIVTSDHGEMLGEDGRFGHSYHLFPQVVQVPLIVHLPSSVSREGIDAAAVSLTIDIAPTVYAALGHEPIRANALMGRPLIRQIDERSRERRRETFVLAASYGAVYASLRNNGRRLYIVDAIRGGDQAYERDASGRWTPVVVAEGLRVVNQLAIRRHVDELARLYRLRGR